MRDAARKAFWPIGIERAQRAFAFEEQLERAVKSSRLFGWPFFCWLALALGIILQRATFSGARAASVSAGGERAPVIC